MAEHKQILERVALLEAQLTELKARRRSRGTRGLLLVASLGVGIFLAGMAVSQEDECVSGVPFCFSSGDTVSASQFNQNFAALANALDTKLSQSAAGDVDITGTLGIGVYTKVCTPTSGVNECSCEAGELAISGGGAAPANGVLAQSRPRVTASDTWQVECTDLSGGDLACNSVRVVCAKLRNLE